MGVKVCHTCQICRTFLIDVQRGFDHDRRLSTELNQNWQLSSANQSAPPRLGRASYQRVNVGIFTLRPHSQDHSIDDHNFLGDKISLQQEGYQDMPYNNVKKDMIVCEQLRKSFVNKNIITRTKSHLCSSRYTFPGSLATLRVHVNFAVPPHLI